MIEIICREDLQKGEEDASKEKRSMPKNIRQVGSPRGRHKILCWVFGIDAAFDRPAIELDILLTIDQFFTCCNFQLLLN